MNPIVSPSYASDSGNDGQSSVSPACQYLVVVSPARLGGGVFIYQLQQPFSLNGNANVSLVANGGISEGASVQAFQPSSSDKTITISISEP